MDLTEHIHCVNITSLNITRGSLANETQACVTCFFPQNCLSNNECLIGTTGITCELCDQTSPDSKYFLFGNSCIKCEDIPWSVISLGVFVFISLGCVFLQDFTQQLCTKLKIIIHFFQLIILSVHVKTQWPPLVIWIVSNIGFGTFTASVAKTRCMLEKTQYKFYLEWLTAIGIPTLIIMLGLIINKKQQRQLVKMRKRENESMEDEILKKICKLRRFIFFIAVVYYMPIAISVIHSLSCSSNFGENMVFRMTMSDIFMYDNSKVCDSIAYQTIQLLLSIFMLVYVVFFPLFLILFTLRQNKWNLLDTKANEFGFAYESYKRRLCFWEALPMLRKLISLGITDTFLIHPVHQSIGVLCLTGFYLLLVILFRPYKNFYWKNSCANNHVVLDVISNIGIGVLQAGGLLVSMNVYPAYLDYIIIGFLGVVVVYWIVTMVTSRCEKQTFLVVEITRSIQDINNETSEDSVQLQQVTSKKSVAFNMKNNKIRQEPDSFDF